MDKKIAFFALVLLSCATPGKEYQGKLERYIREQAPQSDFSYYQSLFEEVLLSIRAD